jgi:hypothetical protein
VRRQKGERKHQKTYNTGDSLVVTDPTTDPAVGCLSRGERTGSRVLNHLWSYVKVEREKRVDEGVCLRFSWKAEAGFCKSLKAQVERGY